MVSMYIEINTVLLHYTKLYDSYINYIRFFLSLSVPSFFYSLANRPGFNWKSPLRDKLAFDPRYPNVSCCFHELNLHKFYTNTKYYLLFY